MGIHSYEHMHIHFEYYFDKNFVKAMFCLGRLLEKDYTFVEKCTQQVDFTENSEKTALLWQHSVVLSEIFPHLKNFSSN